MTNRCSKFINYLTNFNKKSSNFKFTIHEYINSDALINVFNIDNIHIDVIKLTDSEIELFSEPIEQTGRNIDISDWYIKFYKNVE